jgi:cell division protein FtsL
MKEIYYVKPIDNSRLVPVVDPRSRRQYKAILFLAAAVFGMILSSAWQRFNGVEDGYRLESLRIEKQKMLESNRKLRLEEASLGDPVRIDTIARNELGMTGLTPPQIVNGAPVPSATDGSVVANASPFGPIAYQVKSVAAAVP